MIIQAIRAVEWSVDVTCQLCTSGICWRVVTWHNKTVKFKIVNNFLQVETRSFKLRTVSSVHTFTSERAPQPLQLAGVQQASKFQSMDFVSHSDGNLAKGGGSSRQTPEDWCRPEASRPVCNPDCNRGNANDRRRRQCIANIKKAANCNRCITFSGNQLRLC